MIKLSFQKEELLKALEYCKSSIEKKSTASIVSHILFKFKGNECDLNATNYDTTVVVKVSVSESVEEGEIVVPAKYIYDICKVARGETVLFKYDPSNNILDITIEKTKYTVPCLKSDDFPAIPETDKEFTEIEIGKLISYYKKLQFSMTDQNVNKAYSGVLLVKPKDSEENLIEMVTTDIHRLSVLSIKNFSAKIEELEEGLVIPGKNFFDISNIFAESKTALVAVDDEKIFVKGENVLFISKLLKNEFPNYKAVVDNHFSSESKESAVINRKELAEGVKRVVALSSEEKIWATKFNFKGSTLNMTATSSFGWSSVDEILIDKPFSSDKSIGINAKYLLDVLTVLDKQEVNMVAEDGLRALVIMETTDDYQYIHFVMPLRI
ncbi:MAG: DNA polymerase III subunit beta [bacterium]